MIVTIAGGVGGAKMAHGLAGAIDPADLSVIVNTADDFEWHGLQISPDLDTVLYTLSGLVNPETGWGIAGDSRVALDAMTRLGEEPWFLIGDQDLATHVLRTARRRAGASRHRRQGMPHRPRRHDEIDQAFAQRLQDD